MSRSAEVRPNVKRSLPSLACAGMFIAVVVGIAPLACAQAEAAAQPAIQPAGPIVKPAAPTTAPAAAAKTVKLKVGDSAPALSATKWIKGTEIKAFEAGKVYVVEFWATWCGPCIRSMPHITELQSQYKDKGLTIIGVAGSERKGLEHLEKFVADKGELMGYSVVYDEPADMYKRWMDASDQDGIPTAFVVDQKGQIAWIGHPQTGLDDVVAKVIAGTYDVAKVAREAARRAELDKQAEPMLAQAGEAFKAGEKAKVVELLDQVIALDPPMQGRFIFEKVNFQFTQTNEPDAAYAYIRQVMNGPIKDDSVALNAIAWTILDEKAIQTRDLPLARQLAERANEITLDKDPMIMDTLARALFDSGERDKAISKQERAIELSPKGELRDELQRRLDEYKDKAKQG